MKKRRAVKRPPTATEIRSFNERFTGFIQIYDDSDPIMAVYSKACAGAALIVGAPERRHPHYAAAASLLNEMNDHRKRIIKESYVMTVAGISYAEATRATMSLYADQIKEQQSRIAAATMGLRLN